MAKKKLSDFEKFSELMKELGIPLCSSSGSKAGIQSYTPQFARANVPGYAQHEDQEDGRKYFWFPGDSFLFDTDGNFIAVEDTVSNEIFPKKQ